MTLKAWLWRLILSQHHLLPLFPSIPFFQAKSFFRYLYRQALSCLKVYEQSPAWYSICMECCTPTQVMAGWLLSVFQDNLKINVTSLAIFFPNLTPLFPYYPTFVTIIFFLGLMLFLFPEIFLRCDYSICLSPRALSESGRRQGYGGVFLFHAVSSVPSTSPTIQKSR